MFYVISLSVSPGLEVQVCVVDGVGEGDIGGGSLVVGRGLAATGVTAVTAVVTARPRGGGGPSTAAAIVHVAGLGLPVCDVGTEWFARIYMRNVVNLNYFYPTVGWVTPCIKSNVSHSLLIW